MLTSTKIDEKILLLWEKELEDVNKHCYLPGASINRVLNQTKIKSELEPTSYEKNISYHTANYSISLRCLNSAFVWSSVLEWLEFCGKRVCELCPGNNNVIDIALELNRFLGELTKVDYSTFPDTGQSKVRRSYKLNRSNVNIIQDVNKIPESDLVILNHAIDDLYIGIWSDIHNIDYFGKYMKNYESSTECWEQAMEEGDVCEAVLLELFTKLISKINLGGYIIISNYPSSFETYYRQLSRINFTQKLFSDVVEKLSDCGLTEIVCDLEKINGPTGCKFPGSYSIFQKKH